MSKRVTLSTTKVSFRRLKPEVASEHPCKSMCYWEGWPDGASTMAECNEEVPSALCVRMNAATMFLNIA